MRLEGKTAIVTGGASGIGRAICEVFVEEGARLTIADIDVEGGEQTLASVRAAGGEAQFVATDVSKEADVKAMVQAAADAYGSVNILVNDAAAFVFGEIEDITDADWARVFGVNVIGQAYCVKHVLPHMKAVGRWLHREHGVGERVHRAAWIHPVQRIEGGGDAVDALPCDGPCAAQHPRELRVSRLGADAGD